MTTSALSRDQDLCRNFLCVLECLDRDVLVFSGVLDADDEVRWREFREHPFHAYRALDDERQRLCFGLVQVALPARLRSGVIAGLVSYRAAHEAPGWQYDGPRSCGAHLSDAEVASKVRMLMRGDLDHEAVCAMARDRIRDLARNLAAARARIVELEGRSA